MLKIAINLSREYVGGITSSNVNLMNYLYGSDYEFVGIELNAKIHMKGPVMFRNFSPELFHHHIVNIHHLPFPGLLKSSGSLKELEKKYREPIQILRTILRDTKPDIILLSGTYYIPWLISIAASREKIPVVLWYSGVLSRETADSPKEIRNIFTQMEKSMVACAAKIIFPSQICKQVVETEVIKKKIKNSYVIPNPISNIFTDPSAVDYSVERRIAAVGRYSKIKNLDTFFKLHKELLRRGWSHSASFVTDKNTRIKKLPKTMEILPPMNPEGLKKFYLSQGLIVSPSSFETFGNVPMEAVCLGVPVLVSDQMGCAEILQKVGLQNMVISFTDVKKAADRAQELCGQSILPKQINALKRILDSRLIAEEINAVLMSAVKNKK